MTDNSRPSSALQRRIPLSGLVAPVRVGRAGIMVLDPVPATDPIARLVAAMDVANEVEMSGLVAPILVGRSSPMVLDPVPAADPVARRIATAKAANEEELSDVQK